MTVVQVFAEVIERLNFQIFNGYHVVCSSTNIGRQLGLMYGITYYDVKNSNTLLQKHEL